MKPNHQTAQRPLWGIVAFTITLAGLVWSPPVLAGSNCRVCEYTARLAWQSDRKAAASDYSIAIGKAVNFDSRTDRREAAKEAREDYRESIDEAKDIHEARLDLCELLMECRYDPDIDPEDFLSPEDTAETPNPCFPLIPGTVYTYEGDTEEGLETIVVEVTSNTVEIMGVTCIEVRDTVSVEEEGEQVLVEDTLDWYAQHEDGSVWYFGEISFNYEDGVVVDLEGSWKAGEDGAKPGIVMKGTKILGDAYRQEWLLGEAEDAGQIIGLGESITVPYGTFTNCVRTLDLNPHDPETVENKLFAPGVGFVFEEKIGEDETVVLISVVPPLP